MPTAAGPNTKGQENLVFGYDLGDTKNSFKGEPTVNVFNSNGEGFDPLDLYTWATSGHTSTWSRDTTVERSPVGGIPLKEVSSGTDSYSGTYGSGKWNLSSASIGQTWTVTVYAKATAGTNLQLWLFEADTNGAYGGITMQHFSATGNWQRLMVTRTLSDSDVASVQARVATSTNGGVVWWDGLQMEQNDHATPFVVGTRSATQGLIDLTGNSTIDLTNVSFDSNAQMTFDGTSDHIQLTGNILNVDSFTIEAVVNITSTGNYNKPIFVAGDLSSAGIWFFKHRSGLGNRLVMHGYDGVNPRIDVDSVNQVPDAQDTYVAVTFDGNAYQLYMNGEPEDSAVVDNKVGATTTNYIGKQGGTYLDGDIPMMKIYTRGLSAKEIKANYNAIKGRFNI